jgi:hypothetical protein
MEVSQVPQTGEVSLHMHVALKSVLTVYQCAAFFVVIIFLPRASSSLTEDKSHTLSLKIAKNNQTLDQCLQISHEIFEVLTYLGPVNKRSLPQRAATFPRQS